MTKASFKPQARIEDWKIVKVFGGYDALTGRISGHPNQASFVGSYQITSAIIDKNLAAGWVETTNTRYLLGKPAETNDA